MRRGCCKTAVAGSFRRAVHSCRPHTGAPPAGWAPARRRRHRRGTHLGALAEQVAGAQVLEVQVLQDAAPDGGGEDGQHLPGRQVRGVALQVGRRGQGSARGRAALCRRTYTAGVNGPGAWGRRPCRCLGAVRGGPARPPHGARQQAGPSRAAPNDQPRQPQPASQPHLLVRRVLRVKVQAQVLLHRLLELRGDAVGLRRGGGDSG